MISVKYPSIEPLGDRITAVLCAHMISEKEGVEVNMISKLRDQVKISGVIPFGKVRFSTGKVSAQLVFRTQKDIDYKFAELTEHFDSLVTKKVFSKTKKKPYFTYQFDANQRYRRLTKEKQEKILKYYSSKYTPVCLDNGVRFSLEEVWGLIQNAEFHVGVDSGMMHMAKLVIPPEKIHLYVHIKDREDARFADKKNANIYAREMVGRGAILNHIDKLDRKTIKEYSDISSFKRK